MTTVDTIKKLCKEKGIKISRLESDLGFANGYISQLKRGVVRSDRLLMIAEYLGEDLSVFLGGDAQPTKPQPDETDEMLEIIRSNPGMRILFNKAKNATPEQLFAIAQMIETFKNGE